MNIKSIQVSYTEALAKYEEYRKAVKENHQMQYKEQLKAFSYAKRGKRLINIATIIKDAGFDDKLRPKLAICRADAEHCYFYSHNDGYGYYSIDSWPCRGRQIELPNGTFPKESSGKKMRAIVPIIPPSLKPKGSLKNYYILWEAEWEDVPRDPILLRKIKGYVYVVLAAWNLTELEAQLLK